MTLPTVRPGAFGGGVGLLVVFAGLVVIGIGWNGAAGAGGEINHVPDLRAQLPWLISGGVLGLALVVFGSALMVANGARVDRARLEVKLDEVADAMTRPAGAAAPADAAGLYVAGGSSYHRPDCRLAAGRDDVRYLTAQEAHASGLRPCRVCRPEVVETLGS